MGMEYVLFAILVASVYLAPTGFAWITSHDNVWEIFLTNIFFGYLIWPVLMISVFLAWKARTET